jgi:hypothetical protein
VRQTHIWRDKVAYEIESARSEKIALLTLEHYNLRAEEFWERRALLQRQPEH